MLKTMFGITVNSETGKVNRLNNDLCLASAKAFTELFDFEYGNGKRIESGMLEVLVNEAVQGRLNVKDYLSVFVTIGSIKDAIENGYSYKDIVMLRSMYFDFKEIVEFSVQKRKIDWVIKEFDIEEPEIEAVIGMTAETLQNRYVSYKDAKEMFYYI